VFATLLILLMFLAPFGIVGLAKRIGRRFVLLIPRPPLALDGDATAPVVEPGDVPSTPLEDVVPSPPTQGGSP